MLNAQFSVGLALPLLLALGTTMPRVSNDAATLNAPRVAALKCRNPMQAKPVYLVDGHRISEDSSQKMTTGNIQYVAVTCLNPIDSTLMTPRIDLPGVPLVSVWTTSGPFGRVEPAVKAIVDAQNAMFAKSGSYSRDVAKQPLPTLPSDLKMKFEATATVWEATVWFDNVLSPRCHAFGGDNTSGGIDGLTKAPVPAGKIVCNDS